MNNEPEIREPVWVVRSEAYCKFMRTPEYPLFKYLLAYAVRGDRKVDMFNLYVNYYLKGIVAAQWRIHALAEHFGVDDRTVYRWIKELKKIGFIKEAKENRYNRNWNVYKLGTVEFYQDDKNDVRPIERLYYMNILATKAKCEKAAKTFRKSGIPDKNVADKVTKMSGKDITNKG